MPPGVTPPGMLADVEAALVAHFGHEPARASVSFLGVEPIEVLRFDAPAGELAYVSLGMARAPMVGRDQFVRAEQGPRAELALRVRRGPAAEQAWRHLAVLAAAPTVEGVVYEQGMSVDLGTSFGPRTACTGALIAGSDIPPVRAGGATVEVLRVLPATAAELAWARARGAPALVRRWAERDTDTADLERRAVPLDG